MNVTTQQGHAAGTTPVEIGAHQTLVYLVRHGQTTYNVERRFQGQIDVPLSEEGEKQAGAVADWLALQPVSFSALYSSDLLRALETARAIGARIGLIPQPESALREIHVGEWQGLASDEIEARFPGQLAGWRDQAPGFRVPGGETTAELQWRMLNWYRQAISAHQGQAIIVVSHGMALGSLIVGLNEWDLSDRERMAQVRHGNTGVSVLLADHAGNRSRTLLINSLAHLEDGPAAEVHAPVSTDGVA